MKSIKLTKILLGLILITLVSCADPNDPLYGCANIISAPSTPLQELLLAPKSIEIEENTFILQMELTLVNDLSPSLFPKTQPCLSGSIKINKLPSSYKVERFWLINGKEVWETDSILKGTEGGLVIKGGPRWEEPLQEVVIKITNTSGKSFLLRAESIHISNVFL